MGRSNGWALPAPQSAERAARRVALDLELRDLARALLALEPGDVADSGLSLTGLEATVDYLSSAVQAGRA